MSENSVNRLYEAYKSFREIGMPEHRRLRFCMFELKHEPTPDRWEIYLNGTYHPADEELVCELLLAHITEWLKEFFEHWRDQDFFDDFMRPLREKKS